MHRKVLINNKVLLKAVGFEPSGRRFESFRARHLMALSHLRGHSFIRSVIAFANTSGGMLILGVEDKTHYIKGIEEPLVLEEKIVNVISDTIEPTVIPDLEIVPWRDTYLLVLHVHPSSSRPHHYNKLGPEKGTYVRVGSTNRIACSDMISELKRYARSQTFDEQPMIDLYSEAIDFRVASEQFAGSRKLRKSDLETLDILKNYQDRLVLRISLNSHTQSG